MVRMSRLFLFLAVLISLLLSGSAYAQYGASVQGTITDKTGAVVPGATVMATNQATGLTSSMKTTQAGFYRIAALTPGMYTVSVEAPSFAKSITKDVQVAAEQARDLDVALKPAAASEAVTVTEKAPGLQAESPAVTGELTSLEVHALPQVGRDPFELVRLTPGIFGDGARGNKGGAVFLPNATGPGGSNASVYQTENQVQVVANGLRTTTNGYQIDGVGVNSLTWGGAAVITPNQESVQGISIQPFSYLTEDGRFAGAQVKVVSKNGTNNFHGSGFLRYDEPGLNATTPYSDNFNDPNIARNRVGNKQRQFGGSIGGPIKKDGLFFFFSYEALRQLRTDFSNNWVETPQFRQAVTSARTGGVTAQILAMNGVAPRIVSMATPSCAVFGTNPCQVVGNGVDIGSLTGAVGQYVPLDGANWAGGGLDGIPDVQNVEVAVPNFLRGNQYNARLDYNGGMHQLFGSTYISRSESINADAASAARPMDDVRNTPGSEAGTLGWIWAMSNTMLNELRFNATRYAFNQVEAAASTNWGVPRLEIEGLPFDRIRFGAPWSEATPGIFANNTFELRDNMSKVRNTHALKWGLQLTREQDNNNLNGGARPLFSFVRPWNLANDAPIFYQINADPQTGGPGVAQRYFRDTYWGLFFQDQWRVRPNLTLTMGVRYEYFPPMTEAHGTLSNLYMGSQRLVNAQVRVTDRLYRPDKNNFLPRLGFAWSPTALKNKFVVRGGYGIAYNRIADSNFNNSRGNPPFFARYNICCGTSTSDWSTPYNGGQILYALGSSNSPFSYPVNPALAQGIDPVSGGAAAAAVEIYGSGQNMPNAYIQTYSLDTEYQLPASTTLAVGYHGSNGRKLIRLVNQNFLGVTNPKFYAVYFPTPDTNSEYNGLITHVSRRFSNGLLFDLVHTWSRSIDYISNEGPGFTTNQTDPAHLDTERGPSDYNATHTISFSGVYELPFFKNRNDLLGYVLGGFQISPVWTWHTGFPWTPMTGRQGSVPIPGADSIRPVRPVEYFGGAHDGTGNDAFTRPGGNFPNGGPAYFDITRQGPPGIGRNSFVGPRYSSIDLAFGKDTKLPFLHLGEGANLNLRVNMFNVFNQLNLAPFQFGSASVMIEDPHFGMAQTGLAGRVVELQARISF